MPYIGNPIYQSAFVTDQFSGDGTTTAYTMSVAPAGVSNVLVVVSGVVQDPSTYGVVGNTLTFSAAPPSGTGNISCRYLGVPVTGVVTTAYRTVTEFTATASQTTFTPPSYTVGYINVYLNGVLLASTDYTATNGTTVVLATGASAGNILTTESFRVESVANAIPNAAGAVSSSNIVSSPTFGAGLNATGVYAGSYSDGLVFDYSSGNGRITAGASDGIQFRNNGISSPTTLATLNSTGALVLSGGNTSANGVGITFPATQSASTDANTLDDYEEGTWTPTLGGSATYNAQAGSYVKIGRLVYVRGTITVNTIGTGTANSLSGLPFTLASVSINGGAMCSFGYWQNLATNVIALYGSADGGSTTLYFGSKSASGNTIDWTTNVFGNSSRIDFNMTYFASA